jgi:hypothetical protein
MAVWLITSESPVSAEENVIKLPLNDASQVVPRNVTVKAARYGGSEALEVRLAGLYQGPDMDAFAFVPSLDSHDGTIEVDVAGSVLASTLAGSRGFIGVHRCDRRELFRARVSTFGRLTVVPKIRFAVIIQPNISHQVTISNRLRRRQSKSCMSALASSTCKEADWQLIQFI